MYYININSTDCDNIVAKLNDDKTNLLDSASGLSSGEFDVFSSIRPLLNRLPTPALQVALFDSISQGVEGYKKQHGIMPSASVLSAAFNAVYQDTFSKDALMSGSLSEKAMFDSASSLGHDGLGLMPERVITSVLGVFSSYIPFATALPVDIGSNEAKIAPISFSSASDFGNYKVGDSINGVAGGAMFMDSGRLVDLQVPAAGGTGAFTATVTSQFGAIGTANEFICAAVSATNPATPLLPGTVILLNGIPVASENVTINSQSYTTPTTISGTARIPGAGGTFTSYAITGTVNTQTGAISVSSSPALPANSKLFASVRIDFERAEALVPAIKLDANVYSIYAKPSHGAVNLTKSAETQLGNELGIDAHLQLSMALRTQFYSERHYSALNKIRLLATNNTSVFNFDFAAQKPQKTRAQVMQDFLVHLSGQSQLLANRTSDIGITHIYVTGMMRDMLLSLDSTYFAPSGLSDTSGIYRLGLLAGKYEVYYTPRGVSDTSAAGGNTTSLLCISKGSKPAFAPIFVGDAVSPILIKGSTKANSTTTHAFYARSFTEVNPDARFAQACCQINVTNLL